MNRFSNSEMMGSVNGSSEESLSNLLVNPGDLVYQNGGYTPEENVALSSYGSIASASSSRGDYPISNLNDINQDSAWSTTGGIAGHWVSIALPSVRRITKIRFKQGYDGSSGYTPEYRISISEDGTTWTTLLDRTATSNDETFLLPIPTYSKYWRIIALNGVGGYWWVRAFYLFSREPLITQADRLAIGTEGKSLVVSDDLLPIWSNSPTFIIKTAANDPKNATASLRPLGSVGEVVFYNGKVYFCTNSTTPTWEMITSS